MPSQFAITRSRFDEAQKATSPSGSTIVRAEMVKTLAPVAAMQASDPDANDLLLMTNALYLDAKSTAPAREYARKFLASRGLSGVGVASTLTAAERTKRVEEVLRRQLGAQMGEVSILSLPVSVRHAMRDEIAAYLKKNDGNTYTYGDFNEVLDAGAKVAGYAMSIYAQNQTTADEELYVIGFDSNGKRVVVTSVSI
ncbi:MAG: hypothetical protein IT381_26800 [Deltaproteobacteria bacterium]|nr:hypothetical protein [Deltaproteobacteria bacterium]